jgi:hypothetical protein
MKIPFPFYWLPEMTPDLHNYDRPGTYVFNGIFYLAKPTQSGVWIHWSPGSYKTDTNQRHDYHQNPNKT